MTSTRSCGQADLFLGLAQRGGRGVGVMGLGAAAGKADLPGVVAQVVGAAGQQHVQAVAALHQRHQHRSVRRLAAGEGAAVAGNLRLPGLARGEAPPQRVGGQLEAGHRRQVGVGAGTGTACGFRMRGGGTSDGARQAP